MDQIRTTSEVRIPPVHLVVDVLSTLKMRALEMPRSRRATSRDDFTYSDRDDAAVQKLRNHVERISDRYNDTRQEREMIMKFFGVAEKMSHGLYRHRGGKVELFHPVQVYCRLRHAGVKDPLVHYAALLHDSIENRGKKGRRVFVQLLHNAGIDEPTIRQVLPLVEALTNKKVLSIPKNVRGVIPDRLHAKLIEARSAIKRKRYLEYSTRLLNHPDARVRLIKLFDISVNLKSARNESVRKYTAFVTKLSLLSDEALTFYDTANEALFCFRDEVTRIQRWITNYPRASKIFAKPEALSMVS